MAESKSKKQKRSRKQEAGQKHQHQQVEVDHNDATTTTACRASTMLDASSTGCSEFGCMPWLFRSNAYSFADFITTFMSGGLLLSDSEPDNSTIQEVEVEVEVEDEKETVWNEERDELREEIRRLNEEMSALNQRNRSDESIKEEEQETLDVAGGTPQYSADPPAMKLDNNDGWRLQSIIGIMRQTIDQSNLEKELLKQQLSLEQERSKMELKAFAKTLEGVDSLRKSAEIMSKEIRRIKVKGYRPALSDFLGGHGMGQYFEGVHNFGELTKAVEASESMDRAIKLIENQDDGMDEDASCATAATGNVTEPDENQGRVYGGGIKGLSLSMIQDSEREGRFLNFWNNAASSSGKENYCTPKKEEKKRKKKKTPKRNKKREEDSMSRPALASITPKSDRKHKHPKRKPIRANKLLENVARPERKPLRLLQTCNLQTEQLGIRFRTSNRTLKP